jgi:hypothetical protein
MGASSFPKPELLNAKPVLVELVMSVLKGLKPEENGGLDAVFRAQGAGTDPDVDIEGDVCFKIYGSA